MATACPTTPAPACLHLDIYRGDDLNLPIEMLNPDGTPIVITGRTYTAQIRATPDDPAFVDFAVVVDGPNGVVTISLTDLQTADDVPLVGVWDLQEVNGTETTTLIRGRVKATRDVTT